MKILIGADLVPTGTNQTAFEAADVDALVDPALKNLLQSADFRIFNLEVPLTDRETPISKRGPALIASTASAAGIKALGADFLTTANNHILDQGEPGLRSTLAVLDAQGIAHAGADMDLESAAEPHVLELEGRKIGIYCCAEHEFSIAGEHHPGANPFDALVSLDHIADLRSRCDYVIVLYHGGKEQYRYPSPYLQRVCRRIADKGADLVVCQHSHCVGCMEKYRGSTIVYGQGNFLFDDEDNEFWSTGLLISLDTEHPDRVEFIPILKKGSMAALAQEEKEDILEGFLSRSREILVPGFPEAAFDQIAEKELKRYMNMLQGRRYEGTCFRILNKLSGHRLKPWLMRRAYGTAGARNGIIGVMECEVHRECLLHALKKAR